MSSTHYALPLFSIIRKPTGEPERLPDELADQLQAYLEKQFSIKCLAVKFIWVKGEPYLLMQELQKESLAPLCSLADVQKTTLFRYERRGEDEASLTPVVVDPGD